MSLRKIKNIRNFELCRSCNHFFLSHTTIYNHPSHCHILIDPDFKNRPCKCSEFLPKDNLKFLEYKYDKNK